MTNARVIARRFASAAAITAAVLAVLEFAMPQATRPSAVIGAATGRHEREEQASARMQAERIAAGLRALEQVMGCGTRHTLLVLPLPADEPLMPQAWVPDPGPAAMNGMLCR